MAYRSNWMLDIFRWTQNRKQRRDMPYLLAYKLITFFQDKPYITQTATQLESEFLIATECIDTMHPIARAWLKSETTVG